MNTFICENCGNSSYIKENEEYICNRCHTKHKICINCNGTGFVLNNEDFYDCDECNGTGVKKND